MPTTVGGAINQANEGEGKALENLNPSTVKTNKE
jgi:hypothetical protein